MKRIITSLILIPFISYIILWAPQWLFLGVLAIIGVLCFHEYAGLVSLHAIKPPGLFGYASGLLLLLAPQKEFIVVSLIALLSLALALRVCDLSEALPFAACLVIGVIYVFGAWRCAVELHAINRYWLLFGVSLNWVGDIAAYYVGQLMGRHKMAPLVSPGKSWEGAAASVLASVLFAALYFPRLLPTVPLAIALMIAAAGNVAGQLGDLCESSLKRGAGVKDSGTLLPGHGGWLDRVDSSLFSLPVVYLLATRL